MNELSEKGRVQVRFLLGPAGTGKTFQCLREVRAELKRNPIGPTLLFLAPKQATFQIERQLLSDSELHGYTRLRILSFERFANFALNELRAPVPNLLSEDGRVMVLRALLSQKRIGLNVFHSSARLPGFAQQLSALFRELQQSGVTAQRLGQIAARVGESSVLGRKLGDIATLFAAYREWLEAHELQDGNSLLQVATDALRMAPRGHQTHFQLGGVWLDGFAEMTAQELDLLAAALPFSPRATLAFCIDHDPKEDPSWLSTWSVVGQTLRRCRARLSALENAQFQTELLERNSGRTRFTRNPVLANIESSWAAPRESASSQVPARRAEDSAPYPVQILACANPEHEATVAAREILQHVRNGGRYRDTAVLLRSLDGYGDTVRRVFLRYEIPFFVDRREPVAHHPLAELTRFALRTVAFNWRHEDWFGALKTRLCQASADDLDLLENAALAHGWQGERWYQELTHPSRSLQQRLEHVRLGLLPPFAKLRDTIGSVPRNGPQLAEALRQFWSDARVAEQLEEWSERVAALEGTSPAIHQTVWEQMNAWLDDLALAFSHDALPLRDWLPIVETGLSGLTVGAIPPALDQVLVGTIDRSRNPDLKLAILLGLNESVFPAPPPKPVLLTEPERDTLVREDVTLGPSMKHRLGHERYYGYIACTRASEWLVVTYAKADAAGETMQPSSFIRHLQQLVPGLETRDAPLEIPPGESQHWCELIAPLLQAAGSDGDAAPLKPLLAHPRFAPLLDRWRIAQQAPAAQLSAEAVARLYPAQLPISVSALEAFAACPFKFFVSRGLGAQEREEFEPDARHRGSFQHELLAKFHDAVAKSKRQWRQVPVEEARKLIEDIGAQLVPNFENGVFHRDAAAQFTARVLIENVQTLVAQLIQWSRHYGFDPAAAELGFGMKEAPLPAWTLPLEDGRALVLRGQIDRIDLWRYSNGRALAAVMDYKSRPRQLDALKLQHGLELQLLSYLGMVRNLPKLRDFFGVQDLQPAGAFYINLSPKRESAPSRAEGESGSPYQHLGRFDGDSLEMFDIRPEREAAQFKFKRNKNGEFARKGNEALPHEEFRALMQLVEDQLRQHGRRIFDGVIAIDPYRKGTEKACDRCDYAAICRFDSWTQNYRVLRKASAGGNGEEEV